MPAMLWLAGVLLALGLPAQLAPVITPVMWVAAAAIAFMPGRRVYLFGVCACLCTSHIAQRELDTRWHCDERALVVARIASVPQRTARGWQFDARLTFERQPLRPPLRARISWRTGAGTRPRADELWRLAVQFRAPRKPVARDAVEPARNLLRDRIHAEATVVTSPLNERRSAAGWSLLKLREQIAERITTRAIDPSAGALLAALAVGVTGDVSRQQWRVFNATGITHLVAISGMHVTFFALISMAVARRLWRRVPVLAASMRREQFAALAGVLLATAYALLSGFSVPAQRTLIMLCVWMLGRESARASRPSWSLAMALLAVLCFDPFAAISAGFWLSFAAVAAIILVAGARVQSAGAVREAVNVQWVVSLALMPVTISIFGSFSFVGLAVNAVAIPVFTFLLVPPVLLATLGYLLGTDVSGWCANHLIDLAAWVATTGWSWLARSADPVFALWSAVPSSMWFLLALPAAVIALLPWPAMLRLSALLALFSAFVPQAKHPRENQLWVDVLDVGAGTAVVLRTRQHTAIYGSGESFGSAGQRFAEQIAPLLQRMGAPAPELMILGRLNRDRIAALTAADAQFGLAKAGVTTDRIPVPPEAMACQPASWDWNGVTFQLAVTGAPGDCSLRVSTGGTSALLMLESGISGAGVANFQPAQMVLLPRTPAAIPVDLDGGPAGPPGYAIASVSHGEWGASTWRRVRTNLQRQGLLAVSTAEEGPLHIELTPGRTLQIEGRSSLRMGRWNQPDASTTCAR